MSDGGSDWRQVYSRCLATGEAGWPDSLPCTRRLTRCEASRPPTSAGGCGRGVARVTDSLMSLPRRDGGGKKNYKNTDEAVKWQQHHGGRPRRVYWMLFVVLLLSLCVFAALVCLFGYEVIPKSIIEHHHFFRRRGSSAAPPTRLLALGHRQGGLAVFCRPRVRTQRGFPVQGGS